MDINQIKEILPHRYPFLLIDQVLEFEAGKRVVTLKNVSVNENFFQGHFPNQPIMPGVLILENLAQTMAIAGGKTRKNEIFMLIGVDQFRIRTQVEPGDQLISTAIVKAKKMNMYFVDTKAIVRKPDGKEKLCAQANLKCASVVN